MATATAALVAARRTVTLAVRWRRRALAIAAAGASVSAGWLLLHGASDVNLDRLLEAPLTFCALLVAPALVAGGGLAAAIVPRTIAINLAVLAGLLVGANATTWLVERSAPAVHGEPEVNGFRTFYVPHPALGYALAKNCPRCPDKPYTFSFLWMWRQRSDRPRSAPVGATLPLLPPRCRRQGRSRRVISLTRDR